MINEEISNLHVEKNNMTNLPKPDTGVIQQPTQEDLRPSERESRLLQDLFDWAERSGKTHWVWGQPLGIQ
jgi:hypothetical protein